MEKEGKKQNTEPFPVVHLSFTLKREVKKRFNVVLAIEDRKVKEVLSELVIEYIKKKEDYHGL